MSRLRARWSREVAVAVAVLAPLGLGHCAPSVAHAGFWFADVTFQLPPRETAQIGGPIGDHEKQRIRSVASLELSAAYAGLRISFSEDRNAFYRVSVVQDLPDVSRLVRGAAGQSRPFGPVGGAGSVSFSILARNAAYYAPPNADRAAIIDGIGRGIGRAAAHEFAHQILRDASIDNTRDGATYEYGSADRAVQYYGTLHWNGAWNTLLRRLGP